MNMTSYAKALLLCLLPIVSFGQINVNTNFEVLSNQPIDGRDTLTTLADTVNVTWKYAGLDSYVVSLDERWYYNGTKWVKVSSGFLLHGDGAPGGVVVAGIGALYTRTGATGGFYYKSTSSGNTGWVELDNSITNELATATSITNVRDTTSLSPKTGDEFVNSTKDTSGVYSTDRWLLRYGGTGSGSGSDETPYLIDTVTVATGGGVGKPLYLSAVDEKWRLADRDVDSTLSHALIVDSISPTSFIIQSIGNAIINAHGYTVGENYSLSSTAGEVVLSSSLSTGFDQWIFTVRDANTIDLKLSSLTVDLDATGGGVDDQTAAEVPITDAGAFYAGIEVEAALQEIGDSIGAHRTDIDSGGGGGINGSGTINYIPKFTASTTLGNSIIQDNGSRVLIGGDLLSDWADRYFGTWFSTGTAYRLGFNTNTTTRTTNIHAYSNDGSGNITFSTGLPASPVERLKIGNTGALHSGGTGATNTKLYLKTLGNSISTKAIDIYNSDSTSIFTLFDDGAINFTNDVLTAWGTTERYFGTAFSTTYRLGIAVDVTPRTTKIQALSPDASSEISLQTGTVATPVDRMTISNAGIVAIPSGLTALGVTPTKIVGSDASNQLADLILGNGLDITGGTISTTLGVTAGQVAYGGGTSGITSNSNFLRSNAASRETVTIGNLTDVGNFGRVLNQGIHADSSIYQGIYDENLIQLYATSNTGLQTTGNSQSHPILRLGRSRRDVGTINASSDQVAKGDIIGQIAVIQNVNGALFRPAFNLYAVAKDNGYSRVIFDRNETTGMDTLVANRTLELDMETRDITMPGYGAGTKTGTKAMDMAFNANGEILEIVPSYAYMSFGDKGLSFTATGPGTYDRVTSADTLYSNELSLGDLTAQGDTILIGRDGILKVEVSLSFNLPSLGSARIKVLKNGTEIAGGAQIDVPASQPHAQNVSFTSLFSVSDTDVISIGLEGLSGNPTLATGTVYCRFE